MEPLRFDWRPATGADIATLAALYRAAALRTGPQACTPEQARAWASFADDAPAFRRYVGDNDTWLAVRPGDARVLGFCGVSPHGDARELPSLYVLPGAGRRGLGREMLRLTLERAQSAGARRFAAWATPFSLPLFLAQGFGAGEIVREPFAGVVFERQRVERG